MLHRWALCHARDTRASAPLAGASLGATDALWQANENGEGNCSTFCCPLALASECHFLRFVAKARGIYCLHR